ncbi:MAG TPA: type IV pilin protein [Rhodanobacter sp.]|nr:type IV pilin protein [Rhodanobacter sp.]
MIELMIVVAIIAILAAIAIPSYYRYVLRANRSAAEDVMMSMAGAQERFMVDSRQYATSNADLGYANLPETVAPNYGIAVTTSVGPPPSFIITATPISGSNQANDTACNVLTLASDGTKSASGASTNCWK